MDDLRVEPMTAAEFDTFRSRLIRDYAGDHVRAGNWTAGEAPDRAAADIDGLLPEGVRTPGMLLLSARTAGDGPVGHVWIALRGPAAERGAWIYDIEVVPGQRGRGYGRRLLAAAEREAARRGAQAIGLNVFGPNAVARGLYESSGYETTTLQMRKELSG